MEIIELDEREQAIIEIYRKANDEQKHCIIVMANVILKQMHDDGINLNLKPIDNIPLKGRIIPFNKSNI